MVGSGGVGKSALTLQFMYEEVRINEFILIILIICIAVCWRLWTHQSWLIQKKNYVRWGRGSNWYFGHSRLFLFLIFNLWIGSSGQEDYVGIRDHYFRTGEGFMCVFSITDHASLEAASEFRWVIYDNVIYWLKYFSIGGLVLLLFVNLGFSWCHLLIKMLYNEWIGIIIIRS